MVDEITYALMAGGVYISTRADINKFPVPVGWTGILHETDSSGFEAISFINGSEIVISYAGTGPGLNSDWYVNGGLATENLRDRPRLFLSILAA